LPVAVLSDKRANRQRRLAAFVPPVFYGETDPRKWEEPGEAFIRDGDGVPSNTRRQWWIATELPIDRLLSEQRHQGYARSGAPRDVRDAVEPGHSRKSIEGE
jgi:hypothetical protein